MNLRSAANKNLEELNGDVNFGDVKISNVEGEFLDSSKFNDKRGYEYLNSIFYYCSIIFNFIFYFLSSI